MHGLHVLSPLHLACKAFATVLAVEALTGMLLPDVRSQLVCILEGNATAVHRADQVLPLAVVHHSHMQLHVLLAAEGVAALGAGVAHCLFPWGWVLDAPVPLQVGLLSGSVAAVLADVPHTHVTCCNVLVDVGPVIAGGLAVVVGTLPPAIGQPLNLLSALPSCNGLLPKIAGCGEHTLDGC